MKRKFIVNLLRLEFRAKRRVRFGLSSVTHIHTQSNTMGPMRTLVVALLVHYAEAHGYLAYPASRNLLAHVRGGEFDHHSLNGGGPWSVWPTGQWLPGGGGNHPVCGRDAYGSPGPTQATWEAGQIVQVTVVITAGHKGLFFFGLCPSGQERPECFAAHRLKSTTTQSDAIEAPPAYQGTWSFSLRLPDNVPQCDACTLQWYYLTGNSCDPPGVRATGMSQCGTNNAVPEEFFNCADVRIVPKPVPAPQPVRASPRPPVCKCQQGRIGICADIKPTSTHKAACGCSRRRTFKCIKRGAA